nr:LysR substrate-binding domain-containing protein [Paraburkholderia sp. BCC1885]
MDKVRLYVGLDRDCGRINLAKPVSRRLQGGAALRQFGYVEVDCDCMVAITLNNVEQRADIARRNHSTQPSSSTFPASALPKPGEHPVINHTERSSIIFSPFRFEMSTSQRIGETIHPIITDNSNGPCNLIKQCRVGFWMNFQPSLPLHARAAFSRCDRTECVQFDAELHDQASRNAPGLCAAPANEPQRRTHRRRRDVAVDSGAGAGSDRWRARNLRRDRDRISGTLRTTATRQGYETVIRPVPNDFCTTYPDATIEVIIDYAFRDLVSGRFDAGIRFGEKLEQDTVALPLGPALRMAVVASPEYPSRTPALTTPEHLQFHRCINYRKRQGVSTRGSLNPTVVS